MTDAKINELKAKIEASDLHKEYILRLDDAFLTRFLKFTENDVAKAYKSYLAHYKMLTKLPKVDSFIDANRTKEGLAWLVSALEEMVTAIIDKLGYPGSSFYGLNTEGQLMLGMDGSTFETFVKEPKFLDAALYGLVLLYDYLLEIYPEEAYKNGFVIMDDWKSTKLKQANSYMQNRDFLKKYSTIISGAVPVKVSKYYIVQGPQLMSLMGNAFKPFFKAIGFSDEIRANLSFVGTDDLKKKLGEDCLPEFLGGKRKYILHEDYDVADQFLKIFPQKRQ